MSETETHHHKLKGRKKAGSILLNPSGNIPLQRDHSGKSPTEEQKNEENSPRDENDKEPSHSKDSIEVPEESPLVKEQVGQEEEDLVEHLKDLEVNVNSSNSVYLFVLLNILFITSFVLEFRITSANRMNFAIQMEIDEFPWSRDPTLYYNQISNMGGVAFFTNVTIFGNVLIQNRNYTPTRFPAPIDIEVEDRRRLLLENYQEEVKDQRDLQSTQNHYYFLNMFNMFKGMRITYNYDYYGSNPREESFFYAADVETPTMDDVHFTDLLDADIDHVKIEIIFLNIVTQIGLSYQYEFTQTLESIFEKSRKVQPFYPKTFDSDNPDNTTKGFILVFRVLFALSLLTLIIKMVAVDLVRVFKTLFQTHKLVLPLPFLFNIGLSILLVIVLLLSVVQNFNQSGKCQVLSVITEEEFDLFKSFADFNEVFLRLLSVTVALLVVRILLLLNTKFPTFGVLFYTLNSSRHRLLIYGISVVTLMVGFVSVMTINFSHGSTDYSTFGDSIYNLFQFFVGLTDFAGLHAADSKWAKAFYMVYYIIFPLILVQLFYAIIIATYVQLRKKLQLTTLALAELAAEKSNKLKEKYIKLILFRPPKDEMKKNEEEEEDTENQSYTQKYQQQQKRRNLLEILLYNLEEVDWFGFTNHNQQTRDEIEAEIKEKVDVIRKRKAQQREEKFHKRKASLLTKIRKLIIHIIFIIVFTLMLDAELKRPASYDFHETVQNYFLNHQFSTPTGSKTYRQITTLEDFINWFLESYLFRMANIDENDILYPEPLSENIVMMSTAMTRFTIRNLKVEEMTGGSDSSTFWVRAPSDIGPASGVSSDEVTKEVALGSNLGNLSYTPAGSYESYRQNGGYVLLFRSASWSDFGDFINSLTNFEVLNINTAILNLQTVYLDGDSDLLGLCDFTLVIEGSGHIDTFFKTRTFQVNLYSGDSRAWKIFLEIAYVLFIISQTYNLLKHWLREWSQEESRKITPVKDAYKDKRWAIRLLNYNLDRFKVGSFIWALGLRIWQLIKRLITTTLNFFQRDYSKLLGTVCVILSFICFYYYIKIIIKSSELEVDLAVQPNRQAMSPEQQNIQMGRFEEIAILTETYANIQAFNAWLIILRIIFELGFAGELNFVLDLISESAFELVFFMATFAIIMLGFAIAGFFLFGEESRSFKSIERCFLQVLLYMFAGPDAWDRDRLNPLISNAFFVLVIIICVLILLKMFLAILDGQFMELSTKENSEANFGFWELLVQNIEEKMRGKKLEDYLQKTPENASKCLRMRIWARNSLIKFRFGMVKFIRTMIFGEDEKEITELDRKKIERAFATNMINVDLSFREEPQERLADMNDIEFYLKENTERKGDESPRRRTEMEQELSLSNKWLNYLDSTVSAMTNSTVNLSRFGTGARDYINIESKLEPELEKSIQEIENRYRSEVPPSSSMIEYFTNYVAIPEYQKKIKLKKKPSEPEFYQEIANHLYFIFEKSLIEADQEERKYTTMNTEENEDHSPVAAAFAKEFPGKEVKILREERYEDASESLLKFWDMLKLKHKYELWGGDYSHLLKHDIKSCLWQQMKFHGDAFQKFMANVTKAKKEARPIPDKVGMKDLQYFWHYLSDGNHMHSSYKETFSYGDIDVLQMQFVEKFIRGSDNNLIMKLRKKKGIKAKLKFLLGTKHIKHDQKLMLWLLSSIELKMELILRIRNNVLSKFSIFLLLEEVYDNTYLMERIENDLERDLKNKIYMHFFNFSAFESLQNRYRGDKELKIPDEDEGVIDYIRFLEKQLESSQNMKGFYLEEINTLLKEEEPYRKSRNTESDLLLERRSSTTPMLTENDEKDNFIKKKLPHQIRLEELPEEAVDESERLNTSTIVHRNVGEGEDIDQNKRKYSQGNDQHPKAE